MSDAPKYNLPDIHFGEVVPDDERDTGDLEEDLDPESEEYIQQVREAYNDLYDVDFDYILSDDDDEPDEKE